MDVLTEQYCDPMTLSVFWLISVSLFVSLVMYCNIFEKILLRYNLTDRRKLPSYKLNYFY